MEKNGAPNNVSSQTKNYEITPFILWWRQDPFEPFFHAFPEDLKKIAINRILLILPSRKEEREKFFFLSTGTKRLDLAIRRIEFLADK